MTPRRTSSDPTHHPEGRADARRLVSIVPHTHWDREWYRTFQSFRMRLVDLVDGLLDRLDDDPGYAHFMLDGQMAVIDDYLAIRPHEADRIRRLAGAGRLSLGPWYILMDEFLVSGETMVRDMEMGLDRAASFGGAMELGYLPDMFGHIAQMPQILRGFGFEQAVVWRGIPASVDAPAFRWRAPDGSEVLAEYLTDGYSNGALLPADAKELVARISDWAEQHEPRSGDPLLWMNGTDHLMPQGALGRLVAEANDITDDWELRVCSLAEHVAARVAAVTAAEGGIEALPLVVGEMRSGARTNVLMGVTSNRMDVRQRAARAEVGLERRAEPLWALFGSASDWPQSFLDQAWGLVVRNCAHDSICACSVDPVVDAVLHRYDEAIDVADGLVGRALKAIGLAAGGTGAVVVNPIARARVGAVELLLDDTAAADVPAGVQVLQEMPGRREVDRGSLANVAEVIARVLDRDLALTEAELDDSGEATVLVVRTGTGGAIDRPALRAEVRDVIARHDLHRLFTVVREGAPSCQVLARAAVDGFSWARWTARPDDVAPARASGSSLSNGLVDVSVADDGTWSIDGVPGYGRLVDGGDLGDTYNWCPPPAGDVLVSAPSAVAISVVEDGPVRATIRIETTWDLPAGIVDGARAGSIPTPVTTVLSLHAGEAVLRVETTIDNRSEDHRLRVHHPLRARATSSAAGCAYATVTRGLDAEGGPTEMPLPTFPARDHVTAGGLTVVTEGVVEYELVDLSGSGDDATSGEIALTLLRCTGLLSQEPMETRPVPAGPIVATPGAQMIGTTTVRYGLAVDAADPKAVADDVFVPLLVASPRGPHRADGHTALSVEGAEVAAVRRRGGKIEVRVWNPTDEDVSVTVDRTGWLTDLRGRPQQRLDGPLPLRPWQIATLALDD
jgi:mannosylglycerate hydrolase